MQPMKNERPLVMMMQCMYASPVNSKKDKQEKSVQAENIYKSINEKW